MPFLVPIITTSIKGIITSFFTQKMPEEIIFAASPKTCCDLSLLFIARFKSRQR